MIWRRKRMRSESIGDHRGRDDLVICDFDGTDSRTMSGNGLFKVYRPGLEGN
jgi:hypothetical protein